MSEEDFDDEEETKKALEDDGLDDGFNLDHYIEDIDQNENEEEKGRNFFDESNVPRVNSATAKYNLGQAETEQIAELKGEIKRASVEISAQLSDTNGLRRFYGLLDEFWSSLSLLCGSLWREEINTLRKKCWEGILKSENENKTPPEVYYNLKRLKNNLYSIAQAKNLGFAIEKSASSGARGKINE